MKRKYKFGKITFKLNHKGNHQHSPHKCPNCGSNALRMVNAKQNVGCGSHCARPFVCRECGYDSSEE